MSDDGDNDLDAHTARRLAKLRSVPVDLSRVSRILSMQIPRPARRIAWAKPLRAVAASLLIGGLLAVLMTGLSGGPVEASTAQMVQMHEEIVGGRTPVMHVDSIEAANRMLTGQSPGTPKLPNVPSEHVMACCMKSVKNRQVACVMLKNEGVPVTLTVASARDVKPPTCASITHNGMECHVMNANGLNMVMTERNGKWACLISKADSIRLMDIASKLEL